MNTVKSSLKLYESGRYGDEKQTNLTFPVKIKWSIYTGTFNFITNHSKKPTVLSLNKREGDACLEFPLLYYQVKHVLHYIYLII